MAMSAVKFDPEAAVEDRIARLEVGVEHIQADMAEVKIDMRRLNDKIDAVDVKLTAKIDAVDAKLNAKIDTLDERLTAKIDGLDEKLTVKIDGLDEKLTVKIDAESRRLDAKIDSVKDMLMALAISMEKQFGELRAARALDRVWFLLMSAALLGIMGRAFKWI